MSTASPALRVAVICGGNAAEAEVSRASGAKVAESLRKNFEVVDVREPTRALVASLAAGHYDVVFPAMHGQLGEDGSLQGLLDVIGVPYVGTGVRGSAVAMDKPTARLVFQGRGLPTAEGETVDLRLGDIEGQIRAIISRIEPDVVIKPASEGSAIGVSFARGFDAIRAGVASTLEHGERVLVERRFEGLEITVGVVECPDAMPLPVIEIVTPEDEWYDYEHRYTVGKSEHIIPARLPDAVLASLGEAAVEAHRALTCRDLSRADFVASPTGEFVLLEVNTIPGMTETSLFPDAARAAGIDFDELLTELVSRAYERG